MIKNLLIACLACACIGLLVRNFNLRRSLGENAGRQGSPEGITRLAPLAALPGAQSGTAVSAVAAAAAPGSILTPAQLADIRFTVLKNVAWHYSRFLVKSGLSREKTNLLLDLLVDQQMAALEADIQTGSGDAVRIAEKAKVEQAVQLDQKMIQDLVGPEGIVGLERSSAEQIESSTTGEALQALVGQSQIPDASRDQLAKTVQGFNPSQGIGDLIAAQTEITPDIEQRLRSDNAVQMEAVLNQAAGIIGPEQADAFRAWDEAELNKAIDLAKTVWAANHHRS
jgi:hypothetical protein